MKKNYGLDFNMYPINKTKQYPESYNKKLRNQTQKLKHHENEIYLYSRLINGRTLYSFHSSE